jgi:fructooligosaccharide transport system substrate-binding protein
MDRRTFVSTLTLLAISNAGCRERAATTIASRKAPARHPIRVWSHQGQEAENRTIREIARAFNDAHASEGLQVELTFFPDFQYTEKLAIAAAGDDLPDAFDLDGPLVARLVDAKLLAPLDPWFPPETLDDFLPTIIAQGTVGGRLYALGAFESAVVLYYDRELLAHAGVTPASTGEGWTFDTFLDACRRLLGAGIEPLAMHMDEAADEWYTYAFAPVLWSGGGALISPDDSRVRGVLASDANIASLRQWQRVFREGFAATDPVDPNPFARGTVAMDWTGHWMARSHLAAKGARLGAMLLPRIGERHVAPSGSWCWAISAQSPAPARAARWVRWITDVQTGIVPIVRANGAVPARRSAFAMFPEYSEMPYRLFREQLETIARPRPRTPYYATLTQRFAGALREIARGADVERRLRLAEDEVQRVIDRRRGNHAPDEVMRLTTRQLHERNPKP